ncbi:hypothetical protein [Bradyrhizobium sp. LA6.12]|uniref:hypothetical protein n=1 Tax=unclassified Bradyrhizobium TaxID=2631580 RepID=UPI0033937362
MRRIAVLIASAAINVSTMSGVAAECTSNKEFCALWAAVQGEPADAVSKEKTCRAYAASYHESVTLRQIAAQRLDGAQVLVALDFVVNAANDLLAPKCGG